MGCTIPGCGSSGHNRRTHDKHVPPGEPLDPTRFLVGERGPSFVAPDEEDQPILDEIIGLADRVRKHVDSVHPDAECTAECDLMGIIAQPSSGGGDLIADVIYESEGEPEYTEAFPGQSHGPDAGQSVIQAATSGGQDPITADDIRAIPGVDHECEPAPGQVYFCRHCGEDLMIEDDAPEPWITPPWRTVLGPDEPIRITLPGVYELDATEYHDPAITGEWLSNSDARQLIDDGCPAQFRYDRDNGVRKTSEAFSVGHAVHAAILGKGEAIAVRPLVNPDNPDEVWDSWRKHSAQRWKAEQEAAGRSVILPEQAEFVEAMASAVHLKPRAHELLAQPGRPEVALFWVDPVTGVKRRCLVDYLPDGPGPDGVMRPVDIKSADEVAPNDSMEKKLYDHCWHRQAVTIADGIRALGLADEVHFHFIVQSKKAPHLVTVVDLDADAERIGGIENMRAMLVYKECVETGVWPDYAEDTVTLTVPPWISRLYEDEIEVSH